MKIFTIEAGPVATNGYLVVDEKSHTAVVIDAPMQSADWFIKTAKQNGAQIVAIWLTHSHWDHTADVAQLIRETNASVVIHPDDEYRLLDPNAHTVFKMPVSFEPAKATNYIMHGSVIHLSNIAFEVRHTPGHTEGGVCFIQHEHKVVFVGDTLFKESIGRTDLPGGNHETLLKSIRRELLPLPDDYVCYPGHMDITTIGEERENNPFLLDYY